MNGKKQRQLSGKGHNELLAIANPLAQTRVATNACQSQASENRDTCCSTWFWLLRESLQWRAALQQIQHKNQSSHNFLRHWINALWLVSKCPVLAWFPLKEARELSGRLVARPLFPLNRWRAKINGNDDFLETYSMKFSNASVVTFWPRRESWIFQC
jgi:hypothetical protein